ncbi:MAG TPA: TlpA disulfide reductase family protein [Phycisphaerales bacterium]|nr:TlpA disulfide reductase family protein [Phycisphaerales bacterium]
MHTMTKLAVCLVALAGAAPFTALPAPASAHAQPEAATNGRALFERAANVYKNAQAISYRSTNTGEGMIAAAYQPARLLIRLMRVPAGGVGGWLVRATGSLDKGAEHAPVDIAWGESSVEILDASKKTLFEKSIRMGLGPGVSVAQRARVNEALSPSPFAAELSASEYTLEEPATFGGEECDIVRVKVGRNNSSTRWAFAKSDGFPRMIEQVFEGAASGRIAFEFSEVQIDNANPPTIMKREDLKAQLPEGYAEDRSGAQKAPVIPAATPSIKEDGAKPAEQPADAPAPAQPQPAQEPPKAQGPRPAPEFRLATMSGETVGLSSLRGKVVVAQFFGSWCLPCTSWHGMLAESLRDLRGDSLAMLAISVRERDNQNAANELGQAASAYTHLVGGEAVTTDFGVGVYPTTLVINKDGMIVKEFAGETSAETAAAVLVAVREALGLAPSPEAAGAPAQPAAGAESK